MPHKPPEFALLSTAKVILESLLLCLRLTTSQSKWFWLLSKLTLITSIRENLHKPGNWPTIFSRINRASFSLTLAALTTTGAAPEYRPAHAACDLRASFVVADLASQFSSFDRLTVNYGSTGVSCRPACWRTLSCRAWFICCHTQQCHKRK